MITFKTIPKISRWLVCGLCACLLSLGIGFAQAASPFYWDFINVDIALQSNGDMVVTETQKYMFTANHTNQRYRYIPLARIDQITDVAVYDGEEQLPAQTGIQGNQYQIRWQHALDTPVRAPESHTFTVRYRVVGGVQTRGAHSQIFWRALFPERSADIQRGKVTVHLPDELAGKVSQFSSSGGPAINRQVDPQTFEFTVSEPLAPQEFLDVKVRFPAGVLDMETVQSAIAPESNVAIANPSLRTVDRNVWILIVQWCALMAVVTLVLFYLYLNQRPCPSCGKRGIRRINRVIRFATTQHPGEKEVGYACDHCNYRRTHREDIAKWSPRSKSTSGSRSRSGYYGGGYGGGFGGGGSCGGASGGGGGCSGGGGGASGGGGGG